MGDGKVIVTLINEGTEIRIVADQDGFRYLAKLCLYLSKSDYDEHRVPHFHVDPVMNTAEPGSFPMELCLKADP
jgi:hypothetical protein